MAVARSVLRLLGRRLPQIDGTLDVPGLGAPVEIRRDRWGVPYVSAAAAPDAWFGVGFCHAQDRAFQLELLLRVGRGTLAALVGREGLPIDRLSRRCGIHRVSRAQMPAQRADVRALLEAYARGVNAGLTRGGVARPHELALLRARPSAWTAVDVLATSKVLGIGGLAENWTQEHARLMTQALDGAEAVAALEPHAAEWLAAIGDLEALARTVGAGGGSNNWVLAGARTASGRPLLANDPHLPPTVPGLFYLAHVATPDWRLVGATTVGTPGLVSGHNGRAAWGVTSGMADVADLAIEELGPDGASVRDGGRLVPCELREEAILVRGRRKPVVERVLVTPRGPIVSPAGEDGAPALSLRCALLDPAAQLTGPLVMQEARTFAELQATADGWPFPLNVVYADDGGTIGWQFTGRIPRRPAGGDPAPRLAEHAAPWDGWLSSSELPSVADPPAGQLATANNKPLPDGEGPYLGEDWMDGYRAQAIHEALAERDDWDLPATLALQQDARSLPWRELAPFVLALGGANGSAPGASLRRAVALLSDWDGVVAADAPAATLFELLLAELTGRVVRARAPRSADWALGRSVNPIAEHTILGLRRTSQLVRLLRERPEGWFARGWDAELADALETALARLERDHGADPAGWAWGSVRPLRFGHPLGRQKPLDRVFDLPPIPWGGDTNTIPQASVDPLDPTGGPLYVATLRTAIDAGAWDEARFVLATGQSGNPLSPHYDDQHELWRRGEAIAIPHGEEAVAAAAVATLRLVPEG